MIYIMMGDIKMDYDIQSKLFLIITEIERNNIEERSAITGYYKLISDLFSAMATKDLSTDIALRYINEIREIISDEMNHSEKLSKMAIELSGIKPAID